MIDQPLSILFLSFCDPIHFLSCFGSCDYESFAKIRGQMLILMSIQYLTYKYGDFQKALRISLREPSLSTNFIDLYHLPALVALLMGIHSLRLIDFYKRNFPRLISQF